MGVLVRTVRLIVDLEVSDAFDTLPDSYFEAMSYVEFGTDKTDGVWAEPDDHPPVRIVCCYVPDHDCVSRGPDYRRCGMD